MDHTSPPARENFVRRTSAPIEFNEFSKTTVGATRLHRTWLNGLTQNLEAGATAEALPAICDLDLSWLSSRLMQSQQVASQALPRAERADARSVKTTGAASSVHAADGGRALRYAKAQRPHTTDSDIFKRQKQ
jgi:hypothetical protein